MRRFRRTRVRRRSPFRQFDVSTTLQSARQEVGGASGGRGRDVTQEKTGGLVFRDLGSVPL